MRKRYIGQNSIWVGIAHMGLGTVFAQMINIFVQPILTRIFPAETLGIYTYIVSLATIIIPVASLKLDMLIVSDCDDLEAQYITDVCIYINIIISGLYLLIIIIGYYSSKDNIFNNYGAVIFLVPFLVFTNGIRFLFISYNNRYRKYKLISVVAILREATRAILQVVSGFLTLGETALSMGYALSPVVGLHIQAKSYLQKLKVRKLAGLSKIQEVILVKGKRQILYLVPAQFINSLSSSLITISITSIFSARVLGYYSAGVRILDIPIIFITSNVSKVCYQKISEEVMNQKPVCKLLVKVITVLSVISFVGFGILYLIAPALSRIVFGGDYAVAGYYIRCLCVMFALRLVATSFAGVYTVFDRQNFELVLNILLIGVSVLSHICGRFLKLEITQYLWMVGIGYAIIYFIMLLGYVFTCKRYDDTLNFQA